MCLRWRTVVISQFARDELGAYGRVECICPQTPDAKQLEVFEVSQGLVKIWDSMIVDDLGAFLFPPKF